MTDQPRAIVFHEKKGRRHAHCVWSRIDVANMRAINLPHFKRKLTELSREIYVRHTWEMPEGLHKPDNRNSHNYTYAEAAQSKRVQRDPTKLKEMFQNCWQSSDSLAAFKAALLEHGFGLARGDRRGFVAVDAEGEIYSVSRWCGVKPKAMRSRLGNESALPNVEDATSLLATRQTGFHNNAEYQRELDEHRTKLSELVLRQQRERKELRKAQETRRINELTARQDSIPTGFKAAWARLTGAFQTQVKELEIMASACEVRDSVATQALIEKHLSERQALNRQIEYLQAQFDLETEFNRHSSQVDIPLFKSDPRQKLVLSRDPVAFTPAQLYKQPDLILAHLSDKKASFSRNDIIRGLSEFISDPLKLSVASEKVLNSRELVRQESGSVAEFTTRDFQKAKTNLSATADDMAQSGGFGVGAPRIRWAIRNENVKLKAKLGANLSQEQIDAINHLLAPNQLSCVVGLAGTGKSTLLSVAKEAWEKQGYRVHGAALAGKAADSLETSSGISSRTLASLETSWKNGNEPIGCGEILVVDEAGMVGTRQLNRIANQLQKRGCKLVLVGDPDQLQPIEAGNPFKDIVAKNEAAYLTEIRRQSVDWQRQASRDLAQGQLAKALLTYSEHGAVHEGISRNHSIASLVNDYVADWRQNCKNTSRLALAHRRKDVYAINQAVRAAVNADTPPKEEIFIETDYGPRIFAAGDRILFSRNDRELGVRNGMLGTIKMLGFDQLVVELDVDNGEQPRQVSFSPSEFTAIDHGYAVTIHRAQGCTVDRSFVFSSRTLDDNLSYVALTRHRHETGFYTAPDIKQKTSENQRSEKVRMRNGPSRSI